MRYFKSLNKLKIVKNTLSVMSQQHRNTFSFLGSGHCIMVNSSLNSSLEMAQISRAWTICYTLFFSAFPLYAYIYIYIFFLLYTLKEEKRNGERKKMRRRHPGGEWEKENKIFMDYDVY